MSNTVYSIVPAIGIARVGNAPTAFYIGPETEGALPTLPDGRPVGEQDFRDAEGRLCRQAARFRLMRSVDGGPPEEVTLKSAGVASIRWYVHLANKKSSWYEFQTSKGEDGYASNHPLRNADRTGVEDRRALMIDAGPRSIEGSDAPAEHFSRDTIPPGYAGSFPPEGLKPYPIDTLGELRTDEEGRLLVLGGLGHSGSDRPSPHIGQYANNDGWWDDTSDGPVSVKISLLDDEDGPPDVEVGGAWVMVGPPSYAPQIPNLVTLYDTIFDVVVRKQGLRPDLFADGMWKTGPTGYKPFFETDIKPIFERVARYPWVAAIPPKPHSFDFGRLGDPDPKLNGFRAYILDIIRPPGADNVLVNASTGATAMPYLAGDDALGASKPGTVTAATSKYLRLTDTQYFLLQQWADGWFERGAEPAGTAGDPVTRGVLANCVGGAFSPGIEMTWISRNPAIYDGPFRIKARVNASGPLSLGFDPAAGMEPGDVSRYMAVPWQADFNECSSQPIEGRILWWWPAQRPEFVYLPPDPKALLAEPSPALGPQVSWIGTEYNQKADDYIQFADDLDMVKLWDQLGFVFNIGTDGDPYFVEVARRLPRTPGSQGDTAGIGEPARPLVADVP
ncbi:LodA/GoxA family CTQ-dependent oxidase [Azospirillum sp. A26]|uniref:LodA/GoxA family CTQ-dependent oxidase n=1 Tax=Azospirillum sp. A26 TaxID=3160607 RepID=UPI003672BE28